MRKIISVKQVDDMQSVSGQNQSNYDRYGAERNKKSSIFRDWIKKNNLGITRVELKKIKENVFNKLVSSFF